MTTSVFWDLETTDINPIGQILNYCFIELDSAWNVKSKLQGQIPISRLCLPVPGAICANNVDVFEHQAQATLDEARHMLEIRTYLDRVNDYATGKVAWCGYNSNRFDLNYLRTSMIRNGVDPYFRNGIENHDVMHVAQYLACNEPAFATLLSKGTEGKGVFKLQNVTQKLQILKGEQTHDSYDDVMLTVDLARHLEKVYGIDVRTFYSYHGSEYEKKFSIVERTHPQWRASGEVEENEGIGNAPMLYLASSRRASMWVDLEKFQEGKPESDYLRYFNKRLAAFFVRSQYPDTPELKDLARAVYAKHPNSDVDDYFTTPDCDVEQNIYAVSFDGIATLRNDIWNGTDSESTDPLVKVLKLRHMMRTVPKLETAQAQKVFKKYVTYRYGEGVGEDHMIRCRLNKTGEPVYHPSISELSQQILAKSEEFPEKSI